MARYDARQLIERAKSYTVTLKEAVTAAREAYQIISQDIGYTNARLDYKESNYYPDTFAAQYAQSMAKEGVASRILSRAIETAIEANDEFSQPYYRRALLEVAQDPDIYRLAAYGNGWNTRLSVIIAFESSAGSLSDWAHGIIAYRDELGTRVGVEGSNRGLKATNWWFSHVYRNPSLAEETFTNRLSFTGRPAPFWQILNSGSTSMPSDRKDGSFNPVPSAPTDFIGDAEEEIATHFRLVLLNEKEQADREIRFLKDTLNEAYETLGEIDRLIDNLKADENLDRFIIEQLSARSESGDIAQYTDEHKLREAVRKARAGEEFTKERIELTARNAAKRVRPRAGTFIRLVEGFEEL